MAGTTSTARTGNAKGVIPAARKARHGVSTDRKGNAAVANRSGVGAKATSTRIDGRRLHRDVWGFIVQRTGQGVHLSALKLRAILDSHAPPPESDPTDTGLDRRRPVAAPQAALVACEPEPAAVSADQVPRSAVTSAVSRKARRKVAPPKDDDRWESGMPVK